LWVVGVDGVFCGRKDKRGEVFELLLRKGWKEKGLSEFPEKKNFTPGGGTKANPPLIKPTFDQTNLRPGETPEPAWCEKLETEQVDERSNKQKPVEPRHGLVVRQPKTKKKKLKQRQGTNPLLKQVLGEEGGLGR